MQLDRLNDLYTIMAIEAGASAVLFFALLTFSVSLWRVEFHWMGQAVVTLAMVICQAVLTYLCFFGILPPFTNVILTGLVVVVLLRTLSGEDLFPDCILLAACSYLPTILALFVLESRILA